MSGDGVASTLPPASSVFSLSPPTPNDVSAAAFMPRDHNSSFSRRASLQPSLPPVRSSALYPRRASTNDADAGLEAARRCLSRGQKNHEHEVNNRYDSLEAAKGSLLKYLHQIPPSSLPERQETTHVSQQVSEAQTTTESNTKNVNTEVDTSEIVPHLVGNLKNQPRRPISAYNFFFCEEREAILTEMSAPLTQPGENEESVLTRVLGNKTSALDSDEKATFRVATVDKFKDMLTRMLDRHGQRKPHRMVPGKMTFKALVKIIGVRWRALSPRNRRYYHCFAKMDLARYKHELAHAQGIPDTTLESDQ